MDLISQNNLIAKKLDVTCSSVIKKVCKAPTLIWLFFFPINVHKHPPLSLFLPFLITPVWVPWNGTYRIIQYLSLLHLSPHKASLIRAYFMSASMTARMLSHAERRHEVLWKSKVVHKNGEELFEERERRTVKKTARKISRDPILMKQKHAVKGSNNKYLYNMMVTPRELLFSF